MLFVVSSSATPLGGLAPKYTGPGSCSSPSCHGSVRPRANTPILQNEYSTWAVQDKHSRATSVLTNEVGKRIGRNLGIRPETSAKCLDCHALNVPAAEQARSFDSSDGVSCENCHGPASDWLGPHTTRQWTHKGSVDEGMSNIRDPIRRTETCLACHLGTASKGVDHEMIAAGHPDLYFELDSFSAAMPKHWKEPDNDPWVDLRLLATGQAVQLRENMRRIVRDTARYWPEFSEFDCFACHHNLTTAKGSWRQERGYAGRRAGNPSWNASRYAVLKLILEQANPDDMRRLDGELIRVNALVSDLGADRRQIAAAAQAASDLADQVAHRIAGYHFDSQSVVQLMKKISGSGDWISGQGERSAEQAAMVLNSLLIMYCEDQKPNNAVQTQMKTTVAALFRLVENPVGYNPHAFAEQMRVFNGLLR